MRYFSSQDKTVKFLDELVDDKEESLNDSTENDDYTNLNSPGIPLEQENPRNEHLRETNAR